MRRCLQPTEALRTAVKRHLPRVEMAGCQLIKAGNEVQRGFLMATDSDIGPYDGPPTEQQQRSLAWLALAVALTVVMIMILGTMAESRWCGPVLCADQIETNQPETWSRPPGQTAALAAGQTAAQKAHQLLTGGPTRQ